MISIRDVTDLPKLNQLQSKQNIMVRFVMNGCTWCEQSQPMWDDATENAILSSNDAVAEIESEFVDHFKQSMSNRKKINVDGFPKIIIIRGKNVMEHKGRDTTSIVKAIKQMKRNRKRTRKR